MKYHFDENRIERKIKAIETCNRDSNDEEVKYVVQRQGYLYGEVNKNLDDIELIL